MNAIYKLKIGKNSLYKIIKSKVNKKDFLYLTLIYLIFFIPRAIFLGWDEWNVDAQRWMIRSDLFIKNFFNGNFLETYQSYHPGVTLMWLSGLSKLFFYNLFEQVYGYSVKLSSGFVYPEQFYLVSFFAKIPLVLAISFLMSISLWLLYKMINSKALILLISLVISFEPYFLGITRYYHLTGLETAIAFTVLIITIYNLHKCQPKLYISFILGIFISLGCLTKSSGLVYGFFAIILYLIYTRPIYKKITLLNRDFKNHLRIVLIDYLFKNMAILTFGFCVTSIIIFPAMWIDPINTINKILVLGVEQKGFVDGRHNSFLNNKYSYYYEILFIKSLGLTFVFFLLSFRYIKLKNNGAISLISKVFIAFIIYYFVIMSIPSKQMTRYVTIAFPFVSFLAGYSIYNFISSFKNKYLKLISVVLLVIYYFINLAIYFPNFSAFHTDILAGTSGFARYKKPFNDGEYYLQVAQYINSKHGNEAKNINLVTYSDNKDASFRFAFLGKSYTNTPNNISNSLLYYAVDYDEIHRVPSNCNLTKSFGPRWPDDFKFVKLYLCQSQNN